MKLTRREAVLSVGALAVILYGGTAMVAKPKLDQWQNMRARKVELRTEIETDRQLVEQRAEWSEQLGELGAMLPLYPSDAKMDVHWLSLMTAVAARHGVTIRQHKAGQEKQHGYIYELPIECRDWEGELNGVVHFLFDLEKEGGMLDIRQFLIKPKDARSRILRGAFSLYCAYTRTPKKD